MNKVIVIILMIVLGLLFITNQKTDQLVVDFLDIGQGDAILIQTPTGQNILIDGGEDNLPLYQLSSFLPWWERTIDYLIITHNHADHMMALPELLNKYQVKNILVTAHQPDDFLYQIWTESLAKYNLQATIVRVGESFNISDDLYWQVLSADSTHKDYNDNSLVIRLTYGQTNFLFMGDLPSEGEERLLVSDFKLDSEVLKVGHHGSKYSSSQEFLQAVQPEICIIQSGLDNKFGHPHQETIDRLKAVGCQIKDNQLDGNIKVISNGQTLTIE